MDIARLLRSAAVWLSFGVCVIAALVVCFSDFGKVIVALKAFPLKSLPLMFALVAINYLLRFVKWEYFLRKLGLRLPLGDSLWVFFASFTMVISPGKVGEVIKSLLLRNRYGISIAKTAPIVLAERLTDLFGMLCLAVCGFSRFAFGGKTIVFTGLVLFLGLIAVTRPGFWRLLDKSAGRLFPNRFRLRSAIRALEESTSTLLTPSALFVSVPLSAFSWMWEGAALYVIFKGLGVDLPGLFTLSVFAHAFGSIAGALSFLPGGLLVTEGTLSLLFVSAEIPGECAVTATLLIRAITLWFAVLLGLTVFALGARTDDLCLDDSSVGRSPEPV